MACGELQRCRQQRCNFVVVIQRVHVLADRFVWLNVRNPDVICVIRHRFVIRFNRNVIRIIQCWCFFICLIFWRLNSIIRVVQQRLIQRCVVVLVVQHRRHAALLQPV